MKLIGLPHGLLLEESASNYSLPTVFGVFQEDLLSRTVFLFGAIDYCFVGYCPFSEDAVHVFRQSL